MEGVMEKRVTREVVAKAMTELEASGRRPSARAVLERVGGGSMTTILKLMSEVRTADAGVKLEMAPELLDALEQATEAAAGTGLVVVEHPLDAAFTLARDIFDAERLRIERNAEDRIAGVQAQADVEKRRADDRVRELIQDSEAAEAEATRLAAEVEALTAKLSKADAKVERLSKQLATVTTERDSFKAVIGIKPKEQEPAGPLDVRPETSNKAAAAD